MNRPRFAIALMLLTSLAAWSSFAGATKRDSIQVEATHASAEPVTTPQVESRKKPRQGTPSERLLELASKNTTIDVIVGVALDEVWTPDGRLSSDKKSRQRAHIKEKKEELLRRHPRAKRRANRDYNSIPYFVLEVDAHSLRKLMDDESVTSIEENLRGEITLAESTPVMGATAAHARGYRGSGQYVVIIDTGVDRNHPFLSGRVVGADEACFSGFGNHDSACPNGQDTQFGTGAGAPCPIVDTSDTCAHGTHVAGIAAGRNVNTGYNGVAPDAWIIPIQIASWETCNPDYHCGAEITQTDVVSALDYVNTTVLNSHSVAVVSMSLGFTPLQTSRAACDQAAPAFRDIIAALRSNNVAVVAGSGNNALAQPQTLGKIAIPACVSGAISVGATQDDDTVAPYSNTGTFLDFFAPGGGMSVGQMIWSSIPGGGYAEKSGTSMATPHVSGSFAVLRELSPLASVDQLQDNLVQSGTLITDTRLTPPIVKPRIDVNAALDLADTTPPTDPTLFTATGNGSGAVTLTWTESTDDVAVDHYELQRRNRLNIGWSFMADVSGSSYVDTVNPSKMYEYRIIAVDTAGLQSNFQYDYAVTVTFTDDPVSTTTPTTVYGRHVAELREAADAWREFAGLTRIFTYAPQTDFMFVSHFVGPTGVVNAMNSARTQMSLANFVYSSVLAPGIGGKIQKEHVQQMRTAVK